MQLAVIEFSRNVLRWKGNNFSYCFVSYVHINTCISRKYLLYLMCILNKSSAHDPLLLVLSIIMHTH